jgi:hypothetical protein
MKNKLSIIIVSMIFVLLLTSLVYAPGNIPNPGGAFSGVGDILKKAFDILLTIFDLSIFGGSLNKMVALARFVVWLLVFTLFNLGVSAIPGLNGGGGGGGGGNKYTGTIIALCLSLLSAFFMPDSILIAIIEGYHSVVAFLLILVPVVVAVYISYFVIRGNSWYHHAARIGILLVFWLILYQMDQFLATTFFMALFIPKRLFFKGGERR